MAPSHPEIVREIGDGWAVVWDTTVVSDDVRTAFDEARREQRAEDQATRDAGDEQPADNPEPANR